MSIPESPSTDACPTWGILGSYWRVEGGILEEGSLKGVFRGVWIQCQVRGTIKKHRVADFGVSRLCRLPCKHEATLLVHNKSLTYCLDLALNPNPEARNPKPSTLRLAQPPLALFGDTMVPIIA